MLQGVQDLSSLTFWFQGQFYIFDLQESLKMFQYLFQAYAYYKEWPLLHLFRRI